MARLMIQENDSLTTILLDVPLTEAGHRTSVFVRWCGKTPSEDQLSTDLLNGKDGGCELESDNGSCKSIACAVGALSAFPSLGIEDRLESSKTGRELSRETRPNRPLLQLARYLLVPFSHYLAGQRRSKNWSYACRPIMKSTIWYTCRQFKNFTSHISYRFTGRTSTVITRISVVGAYLTWRVDDYSR